MLKPCRSVWSLIKSSQQCLEFPKTKLNIYNIDIFGMEPLSACAKISKKLDYSFATECHTFLGNKLIAVIPDFLHSRLINADFPLL